MSNEAVKAGQIIADEFLMRIARRYEHCNVNIYPDMPYLTPVEAVLRCAQEEGFILTNVIPGGPVGGAGELTALVAKWRAYAASTFNYGSNIETRAIEGAWRMKAKECADELEAALAAKAPQGVPSISEFTPENMPVVTVAGGAPPNASPPSWHRSLAEKAKDEMSEFEKGFPYDAATPAPGAERPMLRELLQGVLDCETQHDENGHAYLKVPARSLNDLGARLREALAAAPPAPHSAKEKEAPMQDSQIKHMVQRFLNWKLPENFNPDGGISFKKICNENTAYPSKNEPVGTNLLDAVQAEAMVRYIVEGIDAAPGSHPTHPTPGYDAAFYEWFKRSPYYDGHWTQESMDYAEGAYLAAGDRHASAERVRQLEAALQQIANSTCSCLSNEDPNWHGERCLKAIALLALPPSTGEKA